MTDVLFTHSYFLRFDPKEHRAMMPYAPLGTLYAASYLRSKGYSTALFDAMLAGSETAIVPALKYHRPRIVVIYDDDFNYLTKMCLSRMRDASFLMTRIAKEHGSIVVVHGSDASDHSDRYLGEGADYVLIGEGEQTLAELVEQLSNGRTPSFSSINGLAYSHDGSCRRNPKREELHNLDVLPFPAWDLIDIGAYRRAWERRHGYFSMNMVTTRGCPFHCNWCAKPIYGQVYNTRSPENVVDEMLWLARTYHPYHLWFCDYIFGLKPGWIPRFAQIVHEKGAAIPFKCLARVDLLLRDEAIVHLARSGCRSVWVGAESGSQKILDAMEKGTTVEQIHQAASLLHRHGIRVGFFLQYGYPGETRGDIESTLRMVKECKPDEIGISVSYPLPGTKFYEKVRTHMGHKRNWFDSQDLDMMFTGEFAPAFYRLLHRVTHKKFRIWQGMDILKHSLAHPTSLSRYAVRRIAAGAYHALTLPRLEGRLNASAPPPRPTAG